jgi:hypothetical protein
MQTIKHKVVKARKEHQCDFCGHKILKGESYDYTLNKGDGGDLYHWRSHVHCAELCSAIWDYVDPDDGMTYDDFNNGVQELMTTFYCPFHCDKFNKETCDCDSCYDDSDNCIRKFAEFMSTRKLNLVLENSVLKWRIIENNKTVNKQ